jgi:hypothetical protein
LVKAGRPDDLGADGKNNEGTMTVYLKLERHKMHYKYFL